MSNGLKDALSWLTDTTVRPEDPRWTEGMPNWFWDEDTEELSDSEKIMRQIRKDMEEWSRKEAARTCECGAAATPNHNAHAYYCPAYRPLI